MKTIKLVPITLGLLFTLSACAPKQESNYYNFEVERAIAKNMGQSNQAGYTQKVANLPGPRPKDEIAPGFLIRIATEEDSHLRGKYRVTYSGELELPYNVSIQAAGLSLAELKQKIRNAYSPYFVGTPNISVSIAGRKRYVDVGGLVVKPGRFLVDERSTIDELVAKAGGLLPSPGNAGEYAAKFVDVKQEGQSRLVRLSEYYAGARDLIPAWRGGDKVFFQSEGADSTSALAAERNYVQVLGQVMNPGEYMYEPGADFFFYLSKAGGPNERANLDNLEVIRVVEGGRKVIPFKMTDMKSVPQIMSGDIIVLHADKAGTAVSNFGTIVGAVATSVIAGAAL